MTPIQKEWLFGLRSNKDQYELTTIRQILEKLGQPQRHPRIVHIAGTNGKGSTLVTLEKLLIESGFSVGSTISPHLLSFNERFRINGLAASEQLLDVAFHRVREVCGYNEALLIDERRLPSIQPSFFEFSIAMAFVIFQGQNLDFLLLETGLGGRLDATNIITNPLVNIITQIDYDHQTFLGESLKEITMEKMGIIKKGAKVFLARQKESVSKQVMDYCEKENIELYLAPKHFCHKIREDETRYIFD
ncbi:MAG: hypothetical protein OEY59_10935, partial [Deltaproteobacteria bacterium]|nr:hypothetical protein [Deltaproteobacteria bacterium]